MKTLLTSSQMQEADAYTIKAKQISSLALMESAAMAFVKVFKKEIVDLNTAISVVCGQGNNGGDGLAIARLLIDEQYHDVKIYVINFSAKQSNDFTQNLNRLIEKKIPFVRVAVPAALEIKSDLIIDAMFGSGLNRPLDDQHAAVAELINQSGQKVISVDLPSGFYAEGEIIDNYNGVVADLVVTFQRPKVNFFFPESAKAVKRFIVVDIGLAEDFIEKQSSNWKLITGKSIRKTIKLRKPFSHKGTYGHALLVAGNIQTMGAALLSARACLRSGAGLTTVCLPKSGLVALNATMPEVMAIPRNETDKNLDFGKFTAAAIGPGLGTEEINESLFEQLIGLKMPLVVDADALTILSKRKDLLALLPPDSILTPHIKEFDRIFGHHKNWWARVETARTEAVARKLIIVLKNQFTFVCLPTGEVRINPTGNPAMASGGMGDVLTGIIVGLLAQSYSSSDAATLATFLHGKAGDQLAKTAAIVTASEVANEIPKVILTMMR